MEKNKKKDIYYCFRYHCKGCPKERICEEESKKEDRRDIHEIRYVYKSKNDRTK